MSDPPLGYRDFALYENNATYFTHPNQVGSTSMVIDYTGTVVQDRLFYPWGQDWELGGTLYDERFASLQHRPEADETVRMLLPTVVSGMQSDRCNPVIARCSRPAGWRSRFSERSKVQSSKWKVARSLCLAHRPGPVKSKASNPPAIPLESAERSKNKAKTKPKTNPNKATKTRQSKVKSRAH